MSRRLGIPERALVLARVQGVHDECVAEGPVFACVRCTKIMFHALNDIYGDLPNAEIVRMTIEADLMSEDDDRV